MRRVEGGGVADLTWCSLLFRAFLYARFTSERGSWVDLGIGSRAGAAAGVRVLSSSCARWGARRDLVKVRACVAVSPQAPTHSRKGRGTCPATESYPARRNPARPPRSRRAHIVAVGPFAAPFIAHRFAEISPSPCQLCILTTHRARHLAKTAIGVQSAQARCGRLF